MDILTKLGYLAQQREITLNHYLEHLNQCHRCQITDIGATGEHIIRLCTPAQNLRSIYNARNRDHVKAYDE